MRSSDILEIRKRFKDETGSIRKIAIAYCAGSDKSVLCRSVRTFNALEEAERLRYLEIFRKGFSGAKDRNILSLPFELDSKMESDVQKDLITLRNSEFKDEAGGYVWDDSAGEERPVKENDHMMDAMRYFVLTMHVNKQQSTYIPLWSA